MRKIILSLVLVTVFLLPLVVQAQGTIHVSNLGQTPSGTLAIGSDAWIAQGFTTGTNSDGYLLNSIQLPMNAASGSPSGFSISLYSYNGNSGTFEPGSYLGSLSGPDPAAGGLFTYTASSLTLSPSTVYFVVLTDAMPVANGYYSSSSIGASIYSSEDGWYITGLVNSSGGSSWTIDRPNQLQLAIYAAPVPEPPTLLLGGLGLIVLSFWRRKP